MAPAWPNSLGTHYSRIPLKKVLRVQIGEDHTKNRGEPVWKLQLHLQNHPSAGLLSSRAPHPSSVLQQLGIQGDISQICVIFAKAEGQTDFGISQAEQRQLEADALVGGRRGGGGGPVFIRETERKMRRGTRKKGGREESVEEAMENQGAPRSRGRI